MNRAIVSGATIALSLVTGPTALADGPTTAEMLAMIDFITRNSPLDHAGEELPEVTVVRETELQLRFRLANAGASAHRHAHSGGHVSAYYDRSANRIFLGDATGTSGASLFHELVHFLQSINVGADMFASHRTCLEAEAYELQALWQTEHGVDLPSKPGYGFVTTLYGICNDADFSWAARSPSADGGLP